MKILKSLKVEDLIFLDIETMRCVDKLEKDTPLYHSWEYKLRYSREADSFGEGTLEEIFEKKAALYSEFAKIVTITIGKIKNGKLILKSYSDHNEAKLLNEFCTTLEGLQGANKNIRLCGHAIIGFDVPFIMRRCIVNGIEIPNLIDTGHLKPWEVTAIDTLVLWKGTGFYGASLLNIATALGLPSPKTDINGSETSDVYWRTDADVIQTGLERITAYCERDVETVCNVVLKMRGDQPIGSELSTVVAVEKVPLMEKIYNTKKITEKDRSTLDDMLKGLDSSEQSDAKLILQATLPKQPKK